MAHLVITIGCEYGAKGNMIGKKVAKDLGIKFYDRDTVDEIIKEVGIPKEIMEKVEEGGTIAGKGAEGDVRGSKPHVAGLRQRLHEGISCRQGAGCVERRSDRCTAQADALAHCDP